jgi:hypothetical protein
VRFPKISAALLAVVAPVAVAGALAVSVAPASAAVHGVKPMATTTCDSLGICTNLFDQQEGPQYILWSAKKYSAPVLIRHASNADPREDFAVQEVGTLADFCKIYGGSGLIPNNAYVCINYGPSFPVYQFEAAPYSVTSGLCIAVKGKATNGKDVLERDCGAAAHSLWVADVNNEVGDTNSLIGVDFPLVNGSDSSFSNALVLTYEGANKQLKVTEEASNGGVVDDAQQWGVTDVS